MPFGKVSREGKKIATKSSPNFHSGCGAFPRFRSHCEKGSLLILVKEKKTKLTVTFKRGIILDRQSFYDTKTVNNGRTTRTLTAVR